MAKLNIHDLQSDFEELDDTTAATICGGSNSFEESLNRLASAFDEAIYRSAQLEALNLQSKLPTTGICTVSLVVTSRF
jgi:hypothetical protein